MLAPLLYFIAIALFGFAVLGAAQLPNDLWLVAAIFPVFIAMILGFVMWIFAWSQFELPVSVGSLLVPIAAAVVSRRRLSTRDRFIAAKRAAIRRSSLTPGDTSTPDDTSIPQG